LKVEGQIFTGSISPLPVEHQKYKKTTIEKSNRYNRAGQIDESDVIKEVHLYASDVELLQDSSISGRIYTINRVDVYNIYKKKTIKKKTMSWLILIIILPLLIGLIGILSINR